MAGRVMKGIHASRPTVIKKTEEIGEIESMVVSIFSPVR
jgi:hypothetical protein